MLLFALSSLCLAAQQAIDVRIDPRIELLTCVYRLQGAMEFNLASSQSAYSKRVDAYFKASKDHPAIQMATKLRDESGIGFDSVPWLAVHMTDIRNPKLISGNHPDDWKRTWKRKDVDKFLPLLADFVRDSNFEAFLKSEESYYQQATRSMKDLLQRKPVGEWLKGFFGEAPNSRSYIIVGLLCGGGNYGVSFRHTDDSIDMTPVLGASEFDQSELPVYGDGDLGLILHEFSHPYINPVVAQHKNLLDIGKPLFSLTKKVLAVNAYGDVQSTMFETFTRAAENSMLQLHAPELVDSNMLEHRTQGFLWESDVADAFAEVSRLKIPISERILRVTPVLERLAKIPKLLLSRYPKIKTFTSTKPNSNGEITFHLEFDQPMNRNSRGLSLSPNSYEVTKKTAYAADGKSLEITIRFQKGVKYDLTFNNNGRGYSSVTGYPMQQVRKSVRF